MKLERLTFFGLVVCLSAGVGCTAEGPQELCERWVAASCDTYLACCGAGERFDGVQCRADLWDACLVALQVSAVSDGYADFDPVAAEDCLSAIDACDLEAPIPDARIMACHNAAPGRGEPGSACSRSSDCRRPDSGYAACYTGVQGNGKGVCANVVVSADGKCGFAADTHVRSVCPASQICDVSGLADPVNVEPIYAFSADCRPPLGAGEPCSFHFGDRTLELSCAEGLHCGHDPADPTISACEERKARGEPCDTLLDECAVGLGCWGDPRTCQGSPEVAPYCYVPPVCGDDLCEPPETIETCEHDCAICGDGVCSIHESWAECASDCPRCPDGFCDPEAGEDAESCPGDCPG